MKVLVVHAHPEPQSFCSTLKNRIVDHFTQSGASVVVRDLYEMNYNPVGDRSDFSSSADPDYFKYQFEQVEAYKADRFSEEMKTEMSFLEEADTVVFTFPLWWFSLPAILKGWVDRVFAMGFAYGNGKGVYDSGTWPNKTAFLCFTTGGPEMAYNGGKNGNLEEILFPIHHGIFYFTGMAVLPPFIAFSPARKTDDERKSDLSSLNTYLKNLHQHKPLYTNR